MFKDKKARQAIEQVRKELGYTCTDWNFPFEKSEESSIKDLHDATKLILKHLELIFISEYDETGPARLVSTKKPVAVPKKKVAAKKKK